MSIASRTSEPQPRSRERWALVAVWVAYLAITLLVAIHHEPWRDEADVWLFARDTTTPSGWLAFLKHSGTPGLWHLLIAPLARSGLPYVSMVYFNVAIVAIGVALFLRHARIPFALKLIFPFTMLPLYEYGVIARSYGLSFTLLVAICAVLAARKPRPIATGILIALLANTNAHSLILAAAFGLYWLIDTLQRRARGAAPPLGAIALGMAIAAAGGLLVVFVLLPPDDPQLVDRTWHLLRVLLNTFEDAFYPTFRRFFGGTLGMATLLVLLFSMARDRALLAFGAASSALLVWLYLFVYPPYLRHAGFLQLAMIAALWIDGSRARVMRRHQIAIGLLALSFLSSAKLAVESAGLDWDAPFSASREAADQLARFDLDSVIVVAHPATTAEAILPYLPIRQLYYPGLDAFRSNLPWNDAYTRGLKLTPEEAFALARKRFPNPQPLIFVSSRHFEDRDPATLGLALRYETETPPPDFKDEESYSIYTSGDVPPRRASAAR